MIRHVVVHSVLPDRLTAAVANALQAAGVEHVAHGDRDPMRAAAAAASDAAAIALIGPYRSRDVADAVEATAPAGLPLLAPVATAAAVTRNDEPGCEDPARHRGTIIRLPARDTEVAARLAADLRAAGRRAYVVAGEHDYGAQLDGQLRLAGLARTDDPAAADVVLLCGLAGAPEVDRAAALAPVPIVAFDGVMGAHHGGLSMALPVAPDPELGLDELMAGVGRARRAAGLVVAGLDAGARERATLLAELRRIGPFDEHGDPVNPPVWLWRADGDGTLTPDRAL